MAERRGLALITGASAGIGRALAEVFARQGHDLVLVARREERLGALAAELTRDHGVETCVRPADLSRPEAPAGLHDWSCERGLVVDYLVNNAGFGLKGDVADLDREAQLDMVRLNVLALTDLTHRYLAGMRERGRGRILNVSSTAAFQAGPQMAVYFATKAYVLYFSEALSEELRGTGVTATTLCPGPTESDFHRIAGYSADSKLTRLRAPVEGVARKGYRGMMRGRPIVVPGLTNKLGVQLVRFVPRALARRVIAAAQRKYGCSYRVP